MTAPWAVSWATALATGSDAALGLVPGADVQPHPPAAAPGVEAGQLGGYVEISFVGSRLGIGSGMRSNGRGGCGSSPVSEAPTYWCVVIHEYENVLGKLVIFRPGWWITRP